MTRSHEPEHIESIGWDARIRTWEWRNQNPLPYHLATSQSAWKDRLFERRRSGTIVSR